MNPSSHCDSLLLLLLLLLLLPPPPFVNNSFVVTRCASSPQIPDLVLKQSLRAFFDSLAPLMVATDGIDNYVFKGSSKAQPLMLLVLLNKLLDTAGYTLGAVAEREVSFARDHPISSLVAPSANQEACILRAAPGPSHGVFKRRPACGVFGANNYLSSQLETESLRRSKAAKAAKAAEASEKVRWE